jgi:hypothetical protein
MRFGRHNPRDYWYIGVDLGQANDYTALAVAEEPVWIGEPPPFDREVMWPADRRGWVSASELVPAQVEFFRQRTYSGHRPHRPPLYLRHLERTRHVSYSVVVQKVVDLLNRPPLAGGSYTLLVDSTGVGRAVFDMMTQLDLGPAAITITAGDQVHAVWGGFNVPKRDLITSTQVMLQDGRLRIAAGLEHAATLTKELADYRVKISPAGHDSYEARTGAHDDLVLATSLVCWFRDFYWNAYDHQAERRMRSQPQEVYR